jgi:hypothetical protein
MNSRSHPDRKASSQDHARCGAKDRAGIRCQRPPLNGRKRCHLHGGLSPGAPRGNKNGNYKDGYWTREAVEERRFIRSLLKEIGL